MLVSELWIDKVQNPKRTWVISSENAVWESTGYFIGPDDLTRGRRSREATSRRATPQAPAWPPCPQLHDRALCSGLEDDIRVGPIRRL